MDVKASWVKSTSLDVKSQKLTWEINGSGVKEVTLIPSVYERVASLDGVQILEGDVVGVTIVVTDGLSDSTPVKKTVNVPLVPPLPVTNLNLTVI